MRLFLSINFDRKTKENIASVQSRLKQAAKGHGRFSDVSNLHLTLAFLGEVEEERLDAVKRAMDRTKVRPFTLRFAKTGFFDRGGQIWWIGAEKCPELTALQKELSDNLRAEGFALEKRAFTPHVTLARQLKLSHACAGDLLPEPFECEADAVCLMLSHRPGGRLTYTELYRI